MIKKLSKILLTFFIVVCSWNVDVQATFEGSNQEEDTIQYLDPNIKWEEEPKVQNNTDNPVMRRRAGNIVNITEDSNVLKDNNGKNIAYAVSIGYDGHFNGKRGKFWTSNGAIAYCLEPLVKLKNGSGFTYQNLINYKKLSDVTEKRINTLVLFGYQYPGHQTDRYYMATQKLIWEEVGATVKLGNSISFDGNGTPYLSGYVNLDAEEAEIKRLANNYLKVPSFNGKTYTLNKGESITLNDTVGILSLMSVSSNDAGLKITKNGNSVTITANTDAESATIKFARSDLNQGTQYQEALVYTKPGEQDVFSAGDADPTFATIKFNINQEGNIQIKKVDDANNPIGGVKFKIGFKSDLSGTLNTDYFEVTTGNDGIAKLEGIKAGKVYYQEISAPDNLIMDTAIKSATVVANDTITVTHKNIRTGDAKIVKENTEGDKVQGAKFSISTNANMTNVFATETTNANGEILFDKLNPGTYYVQETFTPNPYVLDNTIHKVVVSSGETKEIKVINKKQTGQVTLYKEDTETGKISQGDATLVGAKYKVELEDKSYSEIVTIGSDLTGSTSDKFPLGKVKITEIEAPEGYKLSTETVTIDNNYSSQDIAINKIDVTVKDEVIKGNITVMKTRDAIAGKLLQLMRSGFNKDMLLTFENITFQLTRLSDKEVFTRKTDENGMVTFKDIPYGKYLLEEVSNEINEGYHLMKPIIINVDEDGKTYFYNIHNEVIKQKLHIVKLDKETGRRILLKDFSFKVKNLSTGEYVSMTMLNGTVTDTFTTDDNGDVYLPETLIYGNYQLEEVKTGEGYLTTEPIKFSVNDITEPMITVEVRNQAVYGKITVEKFGDALTGVKTDENGNKSFVYEKKALPNAVFKVYAKTDIMSPDGHDIVFKKDQLVDTLITGKKDTTGLLPLGDYYLIEDLAPLNNVNSHERKDVSLKYADKVTPVVFEKTIFNNNRQKVKLNVIKKDSATKEVIPNTEFTLFANEDILSFNGKVLVKKGEKIETIITDKNGNAKFSDSLSPNKYFIKETKPALGFASSDKVHYVDASYKDQNIQDITSELILENERTWVEISKQDVTTGVEVAGNKLQVIDSKGNVVDEWISEEGKSHTIYYLHVGETYTLHEELATTGYTQANDIKFTVKDTGEVQKVVMTNELVKGTIEVSKTGNVLVGKSTDSKGNINFVYEERLLPGAVFEIYADEDIKHPDGVSNDFYKKDELVATLTTDASGKAVLNDVPLGKYRVVEKKSPFGFVINKEIAKVELTYKDQNTSVVSTSTTIKNDRQTVDLSIYKQEVENKKPLADAEFTLYADEDIIAYDGTVLVKKDEIIEVVKSDTDGNVKFTSTLPVEHKFYAVETKQPDGYISNDTVYKFDASYQGQDIKYISLSETVDNKPTRFEIEKLTLAQEPVLNATLQVLDKDGNVVDEWISTKDAHILTGLTVGETYILHELETPFGMATAKDVEFTVRDTYDIQTITMTDAYVYGRFEFAKTGDVFKDTLLGQNEFGQTYEPIFEEAFLDGAEITINAEEDIYVNETLYFEKGEIVEVLTSTEDGFVSSELLPVGKYSWHESKVPYEFLLDTETHYFEIKDNKIDEIQVIKETLKNEKPQFNIELNKVMEQDDLFFGEDAYKDVLFGIFAREDILDYYGNVTINKGSMIYTSAITEEGKLAFAMDLPEGKYYIKELATNEAYILDENEYDFEIKYQDELTDEIIIKINDGKEIVNELYRFDVQVNKVDSATGNVIKHKDFEFTLYKDEACTEVLKTLSADTENGFVLFEHLPFGRFFIKETKSPEGYKLSDDIVEVEITKDGVFVNGELIESEDDVYSFEYINVLMPVVNVPPTDDTTNATMLFSIFSLSGLMLLLTLKRKKEEQE